MDPRRRPSLTSAARSVFAAYLVVLALVVFLPASQAGQVTGVLDWLAGLAGDLLGVSADSAYVVLEFAANIVLFVPFGVLAPIAFPRLRLLTVIALGFATSIVIELVQFAIPSRYPTVSDVIANTLGAAVGCLVVAVVVRRRSTRARALTTARS
ncbi:VanZ family protein [Agromyces sp. Leaf222]|uniref:VanZ family protein n=1 Tax=Agromyces sp. Leaf222 TaxID=1735688 RepID=UPI0009ECB72C|nr:VanZ family protein [Agromyces sp. Leaf222]